MNLVQLLYLASLQLNYNVQVLILLYSNFIFFTSYFGFIYGHVSPLMFFLQNRGKGYELQPSQICIYASRIVIHVAGRTKYVVRAFSTLKKNKFV